MMWWLIILGFIAAGAFWLLFQPDSFRDYFRHLEAHRRHWRRQRNRRRASANAR